MEGLKYLTFTTLWANSAEDKLHDKLETICLKCQILLPEKNKKKYYKVSSAENFTQSAQC